MKKAEQTFFGWRVVGPDGETTAAAGAPSRGQPTAVAGFTRPWRDKRFVTLTGASMFGLFAQIGLLAHLFSLMAPILGIAGAGATMGAATACAIGGRTLLGLTMPPRADRRLIAAANLAVQAVGSVMLFGAGASIPLVLLGCALFGVGIGNLTSLPALIAQTEFRPADLPRVVALMTAVSQAGYAFARRRSGCCAISAASCLPLWRSAPRRCCSRRRPRSNSRLPECSCAAGSRLVLRR